MDPIANLLSFIILFVDFIVRVPLMCTLLLGLKKQLSGRNFVILAIFQAIGFIISGIVIMKMSANGTLLDIHIHIEENWLHERRASLTEPLFYFPHFFIRK